MANSEYQIRGSGAICSVGALGLTVGPGTDRFEIDYTRSSFLVQPAIGMAFMIDNEICFIKAFDGSAIRVARGCADSIPAIHFAEAPMWFFTTSFGTDRREYLNADVMQVKVLMRTSTKVMSLDDSPPQEVVMQGRFGRPYPPGQVFMNGIGFFVQQRIDQLVTEVVAQWAHRDRVTQGDQMIGHEQGDIGPEPGTTYRFKVYEHNTNNLKRTIETAGKTATYTAAMALTDFPSDIVHHGYFILCSVRDGMESLQKYRTDFVYSTSGGWGENWGQSFGY